MPDCVAIQTSDSLTKVFRELFALVFGTSFEGAAPGGGGGAIPHIGYKGDPPKWVSRESILYLFGLVTMHLLSPVTA